MKSVVGVGCEKGAGAGWVTVEMSNTSQLSIPHTSQIHEMEKLIELL